MWENYVETCICFVSFKFWSSQRRLSIPVTAATLPVQPLCHFLWHWAHQWTDQGALCCCTVYNCFSFFGLVCGGLRAVAVRPGASTCPHELAWHKGRDYIHCMASKLTDLKRLGPHFFLNCWKYIKCKGQPKYIESFFEVFSRLTAASDQPSWFEVHHDSNFVAFNQSI